MSSFPFNSKLWKSCETELVQYYGQVGRYYHNLNHVRDCLDQLQATPKCDDHDSLKLALWFHDAIYDATRSDNEAASADLAAEWLEKMDGSRSYCNFMAYIQPAQKFGHFMIGHTYQFFLYPWSMPADK